MTTTRPDTAVDADDPAAPDVLQALAYSYDAVGNIVGIADAAQDIIYYDNTAVVRDQAFAYDALYRLKRATGREKGDRVQPWSGDPAFLDIPNTEALRNYIELYSYDAVGNITQVVHKADPSTVLWTRDYDYASDSNQLESTTEVPGTVHYVHDARGNIVYLPPMRFSSTHVANIEVTFRDQVRKVFLNDDDTAFYFYDSGGQRVRKVVKTGPVEDRRYVGAYESWTRTVSGDVRQARTTLHVMDGQSRICMIETKTITDGDPDSAVTIRYQLGNHLGTACVELDESGGVISYEEYHPYGSTAWWAGDSEVVSQKRYRYTGMERDEEAGLQCHGVRYYAVWLGRWTSADPIGLGDGVNRFCYCHGGPVGGRDSSGLEDDECVEAPIDPPLDECEDVPSDMITLSGPGVTTEWKTLPTKNGNRTYEIVTQPATDDMKQLFATAQAGFTPENTKNLKVPALMSLLSRHLLKATTAPDGNDMEHSGLTFLTKSGRQGIIYVGAGAKWSNGQGYSAGFREAFSLLPADTVFVWGDHSHPRHTEGAEVHSAPFSYEDVRDTVSGINGNAFAVTGINSGVGDTGGFAMIAPGPGARMNAEAKEQFVNSQWHPELHPDIPTYHYGYSIGEALPTLAASVAPFNLVVLRSTPSGYLQMVRP